MEIIYVILLLVIIYLLFTNKTSAEENIQRLENRILDLQQLLQKSIEKKQLNKEDKLWVEFKEKPTVNVEKAIPPPVPVPNKTEQPNKPTIDETIIKRSIPKPDWAMPKHSEPKLSFFERHPDLEKFIGENLINKIGIAILVLAIGFFVKYAIDNNWIGAYGRVGIGVLCGGILIGIAHKMRNNYKAFSSVLVGGGLAILYFTITLAYHEFHLFNQTASFIILIVITCFASLLSLLYDRQELAVIALIGGLSSPFMVSSGNANYNALFIYLVILNAGLLVIAYNKSWRILNISAFGLTVVVFTGAVFSLSGPTYYLGLIYATILYLMFFAINIANNVKENKKFIAADFTILLVNTALYFTVGLYLLTQMDYEHLRGLFSAGLGVINLILSYIMLKNKKVDSNILYLLIGITLTFISLTAPIQLHGHTITLFWAAESVLLYWLYLKSSIKLMKLSAVLVWGAMLLSLLMDWFDLYGSSSTTYIIIANKGFITTISAAIASYLLSNLLAKDEEPKMYGMDIKGNIYQPAAFILLFLSGLFEINHQFLNRYPTTDINILYLMLYVPAFVFALQLLLRKGMSNTITPQVNIVLLSITVVAYLLMAPNFFNNQYDVQVLHKASVSHFAAHWLGAVFVGLIIYQLIITVKNTSSVQIQTTASWLIAAAIVVFLSIEAALASDLIFYSSTTSVDRITTVFVKVGLPILWGLLSFAFMWVGMRDKVRTLRIISLTLFSITLLKLFIVDIRDIPPAGKIAAFFCLGILLLIISFMYQKVKKIIIEDAPSQQ